MAALEWGEKAWLGSMPRKRLPWITTTARKPNQKSPTLPTSKPAVRAASRGQKESPQNEHNLQFPPLAGRLPLGQSSRSSLSVFLRAGGRVDRHGARRLACGYAARVAWIRVDVRFGFLFSLPHMVHDVIHGGPGTLPEFLGWMLAAIVLSTLPFTFHRMVSPHLPGWFSTLPLPMFGVIFAAIAGTWLPAGFAAAQDATLSPQFQHSPLPSEAAVPCSLRTGLRQL